MKKKFSTDLNKSLLATLIRYFPPIEFDETLIDIVNVLMEGSTRGDVYINMREIPRSRALKYEGWPKRHMKALIKSGWTQGDKSPIVLNGDLVSWRRTHNEIAETINKITYEKKVFN